MRTCTPAAGFSSGLTCRADRRIVAAHFNDQETNMLKIWGRQNSSNVRKVLWCAEEIGLAYASIEVGGPFGGTQSAEYVAMNPNGLVPVIEDQGLPLWESNTIVRYLCARYALGTLYPEDAMARAQAEKWMDWSTSRMAPWCVPGSCWRWPMPRWRSSPGCPAIGSPWATFRWARWSTRGSSCRSSARRCRTWKRGTSACSSARHTPKR